MTVEVKKLVNMLKMARQVAYEEAVSDLTERREMMELEPLDEPLVEIEITGYELIEGIRAKRRELCHLDWPEYQEAIDPVESAADAAFYDWLEGMNLRYEAICRTTPPGAPSVWYVTRKVAALAKLTFGGNL